MNATWASCIAPPGATRLAPVSELLTLLEPSKADLCRNRQKDHEVEARDEDVPPATERSGEHPARVRVEGASQDGLAFVTFTGPLEGRIARLPEVVVGIELGVPETDPRGVSEPHLGRRGRGSCRPSPAAHRRADFQCASPFARASQGS